MAKTALNTATIVQTLNHIRDERVHQYITHWDTDLPQASVMVSHDTDGDATSAELTGSGVKALQKMNDEFIADFENFSNDISTLELVTSVVSKVWDDGDRELLELDITEFEAEPVG